MSSDRDEGEADHGARPASESAPRARRRRREPSLERRDWDFNPLLGLEGIKTTMGDLLAELFVARTSGEQAWEPPIDLYRSDRALVMEMSLPGAHRQDIHLHAYPNLLIVSGEVKRAEGPSDGHYHFHERRSGVFQRSIPLPHVVAAEGICASLRDGVLKVTLPLHETPPGKSVQIRID